MDKYRAKFRAFYQRTHSALLSIGMGTGAGATERIQSRQPNCLCQRSVCPTAGITIAIGRLLGQELGVGDSGVAIFAGRCRLVQLCVVISPESTG